jgi:hypothetical protein
MKKWEHPPHNAADFILSGEDSSRICGASAAECSRMRISRLSIIQLGFTIQAATARYDEGRVRAPVHLTRVQADISSGRMTLPRIRLDSIDQIHGEFDSISPAKV